jgi:AcrR family transcriptional regulator
MLVMTNMNSETAPRPYRMEARAQSAERTAERVLDATIELYGERFYDEVSLEDIASRAGVAVQTVLRRFGSKDGLLAAAAERVDQDLERPRAEVPAGDVRAAAACVVSDYERHGDAIMHWLAQEKRAPFVQRFVERGRREHEAWVDRVFATVLAARTGRDRRRFRAQLVAVFDVYTWQLLRRQAGLGRAEAQLAISELAAGLLIPQED